MIKIDLEDETCLAADTIVTDKFSEVHVYVKKDGIRLQNLATVHRERNADYEVLVSVRRKKR